MPISTQPQFMILPVILPEEVPQLLHLHYQTYFRGHTMQPHPPSGPISEPEFVQQHTPYMSKKFGDSTFVLRKLVLTPSASESTSNQKLIGYIALQKSHPVDTRPIAEKEQQIREEIELMNCETEEMKEKSFQMMWKGRTLNEMFLGGGYEARYWLLDALYVDEEWQRKGLGTMLVGWGVDYARREWEKEADGKETGDDNGRGESKVEVEGVWLLSSSAGEKTYRNCGFEKVGEKSAPKPLGDMEGEVLTFSWYVRKF